MKNKNCKNKRPLPVDSLGKCGSKKYQPTRDISNSCKVISFLPKTKKGENPEKNVFPPTDQSLGGIHCMVCLVAAVECFVFSPTR